MKKNYSVALSVLCFLLTTSSAFATKLSDLDLKNYHRILQNGDKIVVVVDRKVYTGTPANLEEQKVTDFQVFRGGGTSNISLADGTRIHIPSSFKPEEDATISKGASSVSTRPLVLEDFEKLQKQGIKKPAVGELVDESSTHPVLSNKIEGSYVQANGRHLSFLDKSGKIVGNYELLNSPEHLSIMKFQGASGGFAVDKLMVVAISPNGKITPFEANHNGLTPMGEADVGGPVVGKHLGTYNKIVSVFQVEGKRLFVTSGKTLYEFDIEGNEIHQTGSEPIGIDGNHLEIKHYKTVVDTGLGFHAEVSAEKLIISGSDGSVEVDLKDLKVMKKSPATASVSNMTRNIVNALREEGATNDQIISAVGNLTKEMGKMNSGKRLSVKVLGEMRLLASQEEVAGEKQKKGGSIDIQTVEAALRTAAEAR